MGQNLNYPRQFPYTDIHGNRKNGTQIITAPFGLAPKDFDMFLGLYTFLKKQPELPNDGQTHMTVDFLARQLQLPATCQKDYLRIRSRLFRFSYVKYTNTAMWNPKEKCYDIVNFGFFNLASLSRFTQSRRPITLQWDPTFLKMIGNSAFLSFDFELYRTLSPVLRRFYLHTTYLGGRGDTGTKMTLACVSQIIRIIANERTVDFRLTGLRPFPFI